MMRYLALASVLLAAGCFSGGYVPIDHYAIDVYVDVPPATTSDATLAMRPLHSARPFKLEMVYRDAGLLLRSYEGSKWAEMPGETVTRAVMDAIVQAGRFEDVGDASDVGVPDLILTGTLRRFDEDRTVEPYEAVCEVDLQLREARTGGRVWGDVLVEREPLDGEGESAYAAAMSAAVSRVAARAAEAIAKH
jgi:ABC-type uncharacterized transport system auxiliary subunit